ncbi:histidine phosphatase superfamily [Umbelopsis sp. PMI_123]|nr:histidine phosphatase superfamily [Umbelopsis sp. PMI_123]
MATNGAQSQVVAVFVLTRHGDRTANYGNPWNFTEAADELTPLGKTMLYNQGQFIHSVYFDPTSTTMVKNISSIYTMSQVNTLASDNEVILASANAFLQGVFPPTLNSTDPTMTSTLANGTTYYPPLGGYQYVPLNTLPDTNDIALDGWVDCTAMKNGFANFQQSQAWQDKEQQTQSFFNNLTPLLGGRPSNLANVYSIYDYLNYQYTYNSTLAQSLGVDNFLYLKSLANWYEYNTYGGNYDSINTIAGATFASQLYNDINTTISSSTKSPIFTYYADGFQTFISFFDLYNLTDTNPEFQSITEFGSALVFEISTQSTNSVQFSDYMVRMLYKNGTDQGTPLVPYGLFGLNSGAMPLDQFMGNISARSVNNLTSWCSLCGNNFSRGCQNLVVAASCSSDRVSPVGAGFIGAAVAIVVGAIGALLFFLSRRRSFRNTETASVIKMNGIDRD